MAANKKRKRAAPRKQTKHRGTTARASKKPAVGKETAKAPKRFSTLGPTGGPRPPYGSFSGKAPSGKRLTGTTGEAGFVGTANSRPSGGTAPVGLGSTPASSQEMPIYPSTIRSPGATGSSAASGRAELTLRLARRLIHVHSTLKCLTGSTRSSGQWQARSNVDDVASDTTTRLSRLSLSR